MPKTHKVRLNALGHHLAGRQSRFQKTAQNKRRRAIGVVVPAPAAITARNKRQARNTVMRQMGQMGVTRRRSSKRITTAMNNVPNLRRSARIQKVKAVQAATAVARAAARAATEEERAAARAAAAAAAAAKKAATAAKKAATAAKKAATAAKKQEIDDLADLFGSSGFGFGPKSNKSNNSL